VTEMRDDLLEQVVDELRTLPPVDDRAVARIVRAASADAAAVRDAAIRADRPWGAVGGWLRSRIPLAAAAGLALAAGLAGYAIRGGGDTSTPLSSRVAGESMAVAVALPAPGASDAPVPTQFVLEAPRASRVSLVGEFNAWDPGITPLTRVGPRGIWTVTVSLPPGRHTYAFMVDDTVWTLDPRAPAAQDPDFGTPSSVVLIRTP
jgi:Glycogen recognition site of AMP-activated protein kinase